MSMFASYLARLDLAVCPQTQMKDIDSPPTPPESDISGEMSPIAGSISSLNPSPTKRPRCDSPDPIPYYVNLSPTSTSGPSFFDFPSPLSSCLRSSSPPPSRPLSRRSSTGASSTSKSVRFARCTNASVFPAFSGEEYDRTPIVPTCEAESLNLPKRECDGTEGWIKCVERARLAAKEKGETIKSARLNPSNQSTSSPMLSPRIEGVKGLVGGGYFVGDDRSSVVQNDDFADNEAENEESVDVDDQDAMVVDDEEDGDSSNSNDEDELEILHTPEVIIEPPSGSQPVTIAAIAALTAIPERPMQPRSRSVSPPHSDAGSAVSNGSAVGEEERQARKEEKEKQQRCKERYGICALGKYTRAEVFQSYDSLGGF